MLPTTQIAEPILQREPDAVASPFAEFPAAYLQARWYAAYTFARHEKRVAEQLQRRDVEYFLPLYESLRPWKDRRKVVQLPLFPGYVFVRIALKDRLQVLQVPSVASLVGFDGHPVPLPEAEVEAIRSCVACGQGVDPHPYLKVGKRVHIVRGPLRGQEGILKRKKGGFRIVLSVDLIMRSIAVDVDAADVAPTSSA